MFIGFLTDISNASGICFLLFIFQPILYLVTLILIFTFRKPLYKLLAGSLLLFTLVLAFKFLPPTGFMIHKGFNYQMKKALTEDEWLHFAKTYKEFRDSVVSVDSTIVDIEKWERDPETQKIIWKYLETNSAISNLKYRGRIFYNRGYIGFVNGGGFIGGWGVKVYISDSDMDIFTVNEHDLKLYKHCKTFHYPG